MQRKADIQIINAYVNANITMNQANPNIEIQNILWTNRAYSYSHALNILELNSSSVIDYIQTDLITKSNNLLTNLNFN